MCKNTLIKELKCDQLQPEREGETTSEKERWCGGTRPSSYHQPLRLYVGGGFGFFSGG